MPVMSVQIPESQDHVTRPIVLKTLKDLAVITGIKPASMTAVGELAISAYNSGNFGAETNTDFGESTSLRVEVTDEFVQRDPTAL